MRIPIIRGVIDRRILVNYRVDAEALARILPLPFRPQLIADGVGMAGICLIRLRGIRPRWFPGFLGIGSENAAHRIAVEWNDRGSLRTGVYIPRRDSSSLFNRLVGGRLFPGIHQHSRFSIHEAGEDYRIEMANSDGTRVLVEGQVTSRLSGDSIFGSLSQASDFFACGSLGYSPTGHSGRYDGLELRTGSWSVTPLAVHRIESTFFADALRFPAGSVEFDCCLLMRNVAHEWHSRETITCRADPLGVSAT